MVCAGRIVTLPLAGFSTAEHVLVPALTHSDFFTGCLFTYFFVPDEGLLCPRTVAVLPSSPCLSPWCTSLAAAGTPSVTSSLHEIGLPKQLQEPGAASSATSQV